MAHTDAHGAPLNHETRDVNLAGAPRFVIGMIVFLAIVFAFIWFVYTRWRADADATRPSVPAITVREGDRLPPLPRLQTTPATDLRGFQESESLVLTTYGWVDKEQGVVRIPVSRAIDLVAERGLPAPIASPPSGEAPGTAPAGTPSAPR
jgi:hypothetical protein